MGDKAWADQRPVCIARFGEDDGGYTGSHTEHERGRRGGVIKTYAIDHVRNKAEGILQHRQEIIFTIGGDGDHDAGDDRELDEGVGEWVEEANGLGGLVEKEEEALSGADVAVGGERREVVSRP